MFKLAGMNDAAHLKISVITPVLNGESTIGSCIQSVVDQAYPHVEHLILDALSKDNTASIVNSSANEKVRFVSEKDNGLYDAMNKGIRLATGDLIAFLGADDMYAHRDVLSHVVEVFQKNPQAEIVYADLVYVDRFDTSKVKRYWKSSPFRPGIYKTGWLPPNTAFFIRKSSMTPGHVFNIDYRYSADYDFNFRLLEKDRMKSIYFPEILVKMRSGGISNSGLKNIYNSLKECHDILKSHHVKFPMLYIINTLVYRLRQVYIPGHVKEEIKSSTP